MANTYEVTLVLIKPDAIQRGLVGRLIQRFEDAGMDICSMRLIMNTPWHTLSLHYEEHKDKPHFTDLIKRMANKRIIALRLGGIDAVAQCRKIIGCTDSLSALPGTIRGDFGRKTEWISDNLVHASDSKENAEREMGIWFKYNL